MLEGIRDLFDLFANGFKEKKFTDGINRSFISTGCLQELHDDPTVINFLPFIKHKTSGTTKITPIGTRTYRDTPVVDENSDIVEAMNNFLDYDSEDESAMNAILNL